MTYAYYQTLTEPQLVTALQQFAGTANDRLNEGFAPQMSFGGSSVNRQREDINRVRQQIDLIMSVLHTLNPTTYPTDPLNRTTVIESIDGSFFSFPRH